jgi:Ni/Fe-hydrogenase 1 B-type cytochrome subunit
MGVRGMSVIDFLNAMVWIDAIMFRLWAFIGIALVVHFIFSIITGRAKKSFIDGIWPEHDSAPPALPKFMHAQHMFMMILLALSGMWIHFPASSPFPKVSMQWLHYFAMIVVSANLIWRVWYAFFSKTNADWKEFRIQKKDAVTLIGVAAFYAYLSNNKPHVAKYNVMQKGTYLMFLLLMFAQMFTGFALLGSETALKISLFGMTPQDLLLGWNLGLIFHSISVAGAWTRVIHYVINWLFIIVTSIHVYLSATIDIPVTMDFFGLKKLQVKPHGHGHADEHGVPEPIAE